MYEVVRTAVSAAELTSIRDALSRVDTEVSDDVRIDCIRLLEEIKAAAAAAQAVVTAAFAVSQKATQAARGVPAARVGRGISSQVGLALRMSPFQASHYAGQAIILTQELPAVFAQFAAGVVPEWRVLKVAQHTAWLSREHRAVVDTEVAPQLERLGNRRTIDLVNKIGYRLDPHGYMNRLTHAETERHVSVRPAPDCMAYLTAFLPLKEAISSYAALNLHAATHVGVEAETRTRGQVMADTLIERITGQTLAGDVPVTVNLIMTDQALFTSGAKPDEPAHLVGGGTIPAGLARRMITDPTGETAMFLRRLYTHPKTGQLVAMETQARLFTANQREFLILRDQTCRTPWCDAPVRHADHVDPHDNGGATSVENGQGLCEACNYSKQAPGWRQHVDLNAPGDIVTITPTGHHYRSQPPDPPAPKRPAQSPMERQFHDLIRAAA